MTVMEMIMVMEMVMEAVMVRIILVLEKRAKRRIVMITFLDLVPKGLMPHHFFVFCK